MVGGRWFFTWTATPTANTCEAPPTPGQRIALGWQRLRRGVWSLVAGPQPPEPQPNTSYREEQVQRARRVVVRAGLRRGPLVQLVGSELDEDDLVIVNPREAVRDGVLVQIAGGGEGA